jgi:hypothetical protein
MLSSLFFLNSCWKKTQRKTTNDMLQDKTKIKIRQQGAIATPPPTTHEHQIYSIVKKKQTKKKKKNLTWL